MDSYRLGFAIEDFQARMKALGIDVSAIVLGNEASKHALISALMPACCMPNENGMEPGVVARICGVEVRHLNR